jgi:hypothetical protein
MATLEQWSAALWELYYPEMPKPRPTYLAMDDEDLLQIGAQLLGIDDVVEIRRDLVNVVLDELQLGQASSLVFARTDNATRSWYKANKAIRSGLVSAPPQLPLLAVTVIAAREIGGDSSDSLGFYKSLRRVLGLREEFEGKLTDAYRHSIEGLWKHLNQVLVELKYARGIPTATAPTDRYVSIPVSQSILRRHDLRKLIEFFIDADLRPDSAPSQLELEQLFEWWLNRGGHSISVNLETLWNRGKAERGRVLEVLTSQLEHWDGSLPEVSGAYARTAQLRVFAVRDVDWFGNTSLTVGLAHQASTPFTGDVASITSPRQEYQDTQASRIGRSGFFTITPGSISTSSDLLMSEFEFESAEIGAAKKVPKAIYVLRFNPELQCFIESGKPNLGESLIVIASSALGVADKVKDVLATHAEEGLTELAESTHGIKGWRVFQDVKFVYPYSHAVELAPLTTNSNASLGFIGGLKLVEEPGVRIWSRHWLPTLDASVPEGSVLKLKLFKDSPANSDDLVLEEVGFGRVQIDLRDRPISDGSYRAELFVASDANPIATKRFAVRSESTPRKFELHTAEVLGYLPDSPQVPSWTDSPMAWRGFPSVHSQHASVPVALEIPTEPWWGSAPTQLTQVSRLLAPTLPNETSCSFSGRHRWELDTCEGQQRYVNAICHQCGSQRRELCAARFALRAENRIRPVSIPVARAVPLEIEQTEKLPVVSWPRLKALDSSLRFLRQGTYKEIKEAAASIGLDAIQTRRFVRWLEASGSLEIENHFSEEATWCLNPAAIVQVPTGGFRLVGDLNPAIWTRLLTQISRDDITESPSPYGVHVSIDDLVDPEAIAAGAGVTYVSDPVGSLAREVKPISEVLDGRSLEQLPEGAKYEKFNSTNANWELVSMGRIGSAGSYRVIGSFQTSVFYVPVEGVERNKGYRLDAITAKYLDCFFKGQPLVSYNPDELKLFVPFGMELPGLVGRLAVSASGNPPKTVRKTVAGEKIPLIKYDNIDEDMAYVIYSCLGGKR